MEFKATQTSVASLQEEPVYVELVDSTKECVEEFRNDLVELHTSFTEFSTRVTAAIQDEKEKRMKDVGGSGMSHKWVLGACWGWGSINLSKDRWG